MGTATNTSEPAAGNPSDPNPDHVQALLEAARYDDIEDLVSIISTGVPPNARDSEGRTALHMAAANGHLEIVEYLIRNGADVNAMNLEKNTPLHWACLNGHMEVIKLLIQGGASVSVLNSHERTPMDEAVSRGKMDVVDAINTAVAQLEMDDVLRIKLSDSNAEVGILQGMQKLWQGKAKVVNGFFSLKP